MILLFPIGISAQGLKFKGNESLINDRTSYSVFDQISPLFTDNLDLSFDISFKEPSYRGNVLRIKNNEKKTIYNLSIDRGGKSSIRFQFNEEGKANLIDTNLDTQKLDESLWVNIRILFDLTKNSLQLIINGETFSIENLDLSKTWRPAIFFGKSDHIIDVPSFAIKNLTINDNKQKYIFPLTENEGGDVHDAKGKITGHVTSPVWLINDAYYWKHQATFKSQMIAGANFNTETQEMYYFNQDSITIYNVRTGKTHSEKYTNKCPIILKLGTNFIDQTNNHLVAYEVYGENKADYTNIAYLDLEDYTWHSAEKDFLRMQLHHHAGYYNDKTRKYTIFGGFGNLSYSKDFYSLDLDTYKWSGLSLTGDNIDPRYFSSMGYSDKTNSIYIFGGMGNESGDQTVGRRYYYDLHKVDVVTSKVSKVWEIPWGEDNVVPARRIIIDNDSSFYTLCYPEHFSDTFLKLYKFSIKDGNYQILGDSIPIRSEKIKTNANLFYNQKLKEIYVIVQEFDNQDIASHVRMYSLSFPPITLQELSGYANLAKGSSNWYWFALLIIPFGGIVSYLVKKQKEREIINTKKSSLEISKDTLPTIQNSDKANAIYLFGDFSVRNKDNKDITYMFSTKLKHAFLLILQHSLKDGISSQQLSETLWPDKPDNKVKNSRGVTLNHLRKTLSELDNVNLIYEKGLFQIIISDKCYCDCVHCLEIIDTGLTEKNSLEFAQILSRGKFLKSIDHPMLDSFKETVEYKIEPILLAEMETNFKKENYQATILLAEAMLNIDPINETTTRYLIHSMLKLKKSEEAKKRYISFVSEYKITIGEEYPKSFSTFIDLT